MTRTPKDHGRRQGLPNYRPDLDIYESKSEEDETDLDRVIGKIRIFGYWTKPPQFVVK